MRKRICKALYTLYDIFPVLNRPMALCALFSVASILFLYNHADSSVSLLILFAIFALLICLLTKNKKIIIISILFLAVSASAVNEIYTVKDLEALDGQTVNLDLLAIEDSDFTGKASHVTVYCYNSDLIPKYTKLSLYYYGDEKLNCGDKFNATISISKVDDNYRILNLGNSVYISSKLIKCNKRYESSAFFSFIGEVRHYISDTIKNRFSGDVSSSLLAINAGDRQFLSDDYYNKVIVSGLSHIMVVSGLHLSIILGLLFRLFEKFFYNRFLKAATSVAAILFMFAVFGFTQSILRAGTMFIFSALSPLFMRKNDILNSLGAAVLLMLYFSPFCIFSVAFELSVLSTVAVVWIAPFYSEHIKEKLLIKNKFGRGVTEIIVVSITAMLFTAPIAINTFGYISLLAPFAFLLITFPVTWALVFNSAGLLLNLFGSISAISIPFFIIAGLCTKYINFIIDNLGLLDILYIEVGKTGYFISLLLILILIFGMCADKYYQKLKRRRFVLEVKTHADSLRKPVKSSNK